MSNDSILASFFCGQAGSYAASAGDAKGRLEIVRERVKELEADVKNGQANVEGMIEVRNVLVEALRELNPNHPLLRQENRQRIFETARKRKMDNLKT